MTFDCGKCLARCRADCCRGPAPIPRETYESRKPAREVHEVLDSGDGWVTVMHFEPLPGGKKLATCAYLGKDLRCSIQDDKPQPCRKFGDESHPFMVCSWQAKDGRIRSREERRRIERAQAKDAWEKVRAAAGMGGSR